MRRLGVIVLGLVVLGSAGAGAQGFGQPNIGVQRGVDVPRPVEALPLSAQPAPPSVQAIRRVHRNAAGKLEPDDGCDWVSSEPSDFRVRCNAD